MQRRSSFAKYFQQNDQKSESGYFSQDAVVQESEPQRNKETRSILKKPTIVPVKRPSSVGHHSSRSESSEADRPMSLNKKRLSWGAAKVMEFRALNKATDEEGKEGRRSM